MTVSPGPVYENPARASTSALWVEAGGQSRKVANLSDLVRGKSSFLIEMLNFSIEDLTSQLVVGTLSSLS